jgi:hypothetical protein
METVLICVRTVICASNIHLSSDSEFDVSPAGICSAHALIAWLLGYDALSLLFADSCQVAERQSVLASGESMSCGWQFGELASCGEELTCEYNVQFYRPLMNCWNWFMCV